MMPNTLKRPGVEVVSGLINTVTKDVLLKSICFLHKNTGIFSLGDTQTETSLHQMDN